MSKKKAKSGSSNRHSELYHNTRKAVVNGRHLFQALATTATGAVVAVGNHTRPQDAAKAADLAALALRRGKVNFNRANYTQRMVDKERERLGKLGVLPTEPQQVAKRQRKSSSKKQQAKPSSKSKVQHHTHETQQAQKEATIAAAEVEPQQHKASRKRKAGGSQSPAAAAEASTGKQHAAAAAGGAGEARTKRRKVELQRPCTPDSPAPDAVQLRNKQRPPPPPPAAAAGAASTALVPAAAGPLVQHPTGSAVGLQPGAVSQEVLMQQLRSALAAHEASKRQMQAALLALEASEGQLAAVARAAGLTAG